MRKIRKLLWPFSALYWLITAVRNKLYDIGFFKSKSYHVPIIAVGNLSTGGTGKTPMIECLIKLFSSTYKIATLSRGYKRSTKGFLLADQRTTVDALGDEPYQFFKKFPGIFVAVDTNRRRGIEKLLTLANPDLILLDDAFQHRAVQADLYILLTTYDDLYTADLLLPAGNLREGKYGAKRAQIIVVTKCPAQLSATEKTAVAAKLNLLPHQTLFFASIAYDNYITNDEYTITVQEAKKTKKVLLAGIANPAPFFNYLKSQEDKVLSFADHHQFTAHDIASIAKHAEGNLVVCTEKDYVKLKGKMEQALYYLPIRTAISEQELFKKLVLAHLK